MKVNRIAKSYVALALLVAFSVSACSSNDIAQVNAGIKVVSRDGHHRGGLGQGRPPEGGAKHSVCEALQQGPLNNAEHGPMNNADFNRDGTVMRDELEAFMDQGKYRRISMLTFFDLFDTNKDNRLSDKEFAKVDPPYGFDGTDENGDCVVTREEVLAYANQAGRSYRKIGLGQFFALMDTNNDNKVITTEVDAAHESGLLARF